MKMKEVTAEEMRYGQPKVNASVDRNEKAKGGERSKVSERFKTLQISIFLFAILKRIKNANK